MELIKYGSSIKYGNIRIFKIYLVLKLNRVKRREIQISHLLRYLG